MLRSSAEEPLHGSRDASAEEQEHPPRPKIAFWRGARSGRWSVKPARAVKAVMTAERVRCESCRTRAERMRVKGVIGDEMVVAIAEVMKSFAHEERSMSSGRVTVRSRMTMTAMTMAVMTMSSVTVASVPVAAVTVPTMAPAYGNRRRRRSQD